MCSVGVCGRSSARVPCPSIVGTPADANGGGLTQVNPALSPCAIIDSMNGLSDDELAALTDRLSERKAVLLNEIRQVLARSRDERDADLAGGVGDATDGSVPEQLRDVVDFTCQQQRESIRARQSPTP